MGADCVPGPSERPGRGGAGGSGSRSTRIRLYGTCMLWPWTGCSAPLGSAAPLEPRAALGSAAPRMVALPEVGQFFLKARTRKSAPGTAASCSHVPVKGCGDKMPPGLPLSRYLSCGLKMLLRMILCFRRFSSVFSRG